MSTPFTTHVDIQCVYPISGNYGIAPRFLYYCLVFFVALFQRYPKLTAGAAAYCISYAGATAVHAVILAVISGSSTPFLPDGYVSENTTSSVWVASRVLDQDVDTYLCRGRSRLPFVPDPSRFDGLLRKDGSNEVHHCSMGPLDVCGNRCLHGQFLRRQRIRIRAFLAIPLLSAGADDALPLSGLPPPILGLDWNETVWSFFRSSGDANNNNDTPNAKCLYPCLASSQILRDQPYIQVVSFSSLQIAGPGQVLYTVMAVITWGALPLTVLAGFVLVVGQWIGGFPPADSPPFAGYASLWDNLIRQPEVSDAKRTAFKSVTVTVLQVYALIITPILMVVLIVFMEWSLSAYPRSETVWHVGQWSPLVGVGFVFIAILVSGRWAPSKRIPLPRVGMTQMVRNPMAWVLRQTYFHQGRKL
ncbi:hypothetical protein PG987_014291 [Apiospora arundinis]